MAKQQKHIFTYCMLSSFIMRRYVEPVSQYTNRSRKPQWTSNSLFQHKEILVFQLNR